MTRRYAWAGMLFNALKLESAEAVEPEGPGASAARSLPAPASVELKALSRCGPNCSWSPARPSLFSAVAERLGAQRRQRRSRWRPLKRRVRRDYCCEDHA